MANVDHRFATFSRAPVVTGLALAALLAAPAGAPPPEPSGFPEAALPLVDADAPTNAKLWLLGGSFEPTTLAVVAAADGTPLPATVTRHACCLAEVDLGALPTGATITFSASGQTLDLDGSFIAGSAEDTTAPAPPANVVVDAPVRVRAFAPPAGAANEAGIEVQAHATRGDIDSALWVALADDDTWLAVAQPSDRFYVGVPAADDAAEACLRLAALDLAGNLSAASERVCVTVPDDPPPLDEGRELACSCVTSAPRPRLAGLWVLLLVPVLRRRRG